MSPTARQELRSYARRVRKESKQRDREFYLRNPNAGFCLGVALGIAAVALMGLWWFVTKH